MARQQQASRHECFCKRGQTRRAVPFSSRLSDAMQRREADGQENELGAGHRGRRNREPPVIANAEAPSPAAARGARPSG